MATTTMDAGALTAALVLFAGHIKAGNTDEAVNLMQKMKAEVSPTEDLLRSTKAGATLAKEARNNKEKRIADMAKEVVASWKDVIENQRKRKRGDKEGSQSQSGGGGGGDNKKVKTEVDAKKKSPAVSTPPAGDGKDVKPKIEPGGGDVKPISKTEGDTDVKGEIKEETKPSPSAIASGSRPTSPGKQMSPPSDNFDTIDLARKVMRTAKSDSMSSIKAEEEDGERADPVRDKCVIMIYDALAGDSTASTKILSERAISLERAVYAQFNFATNNDYRAKIRTLFLNLKDKTNPGLRNKISIGSISADQVVNMTKEEMASESVKAMNEKLAKDNLFKAKAVVELQASTTAFKCGKCQQRDCSFYQMQTRSADEPMTTFVTCKSCGHKWKFC